jgi:hypothetical protein
MKVDHTFIVVIDTRTNTNPEAFDLQEIEGYMMLQICETLLSEKKLNEDVSEEYLMEFYKKFKNMTKYHRNDEEESIAIVTKVPADFNFDF